MYGCPFPDIVTFQCTPVFKWLAAKKHTLILCWKTFLILDLFFHLLYCIFVAGHNPKSFSSQSLYIYWKLKLIYTCWNFNMLYHFWMCLNNSLKCDKCCKIIKNLFLYVDFGNFCLSFISNNLFLRIVKFLIKSPFILFGSEIFFYSFEDLVNRLDLLMSYERS